MDNKKLSCSFCKSEGKHTTLCCINKYNAEKTGPGTAAAVEEEMECNAINGESKDEGDKMEMDKVDHPTATTTSTLPAEVLAPSSKDMNGELDEEVVEYDGRFRYPGGDDLAEHDIANEATGAKTESTREHSPLNKTTTIQDQMEVV